MGDARVSNAPFVAVFPTCLGVGQRKQPLWDGTRLVTMLRNLLRQLLAFTKREGSIRTLTWIHFFVSP